MQKSNIIFYPVDLRFAGKDEAILAAIDENLAEIKQDPDSIYYKTLILKKLFLFLFSFLLIENKLEFKNAKLESTHT